jgi:hypothetical protein
MIYWYFILSCLRLIGVNHITSDGKPKNCDNSSWRTVEKYLLNNIFPILVKSKMY